MLYIQVNSNGVLYEQQHRVNSRSVRNEVKLKDGDRSSTRDTAMRFIVDPPRDRTGGN